MVTKARQLAELISNSLVDSDEISTGAVTTSKLAGTLDFSSKTMVMADNQLSGDKIHGGTISAFTSTGIDDNASSTAVTITSDSNVGIGTSSPNNYNNWTTLTLNNASGGEIDFEAGGVLKADFFANSNDMFIRHHSGNIRFYTNGTALQNERMRIDSSGNVGIGTDDPDSRLHIKAGDSGYTGGIQIEDNDSTTKSAITHVNGALYISSNTTADHISILSNGNVGIGTSSPSDRLVVQQDASGIQPMLVLKNDNTTDDNGVSIDFAGKDTSSNNITYGRIAARYSNHSTEKSHIIFSHRDNNGAFSEWMRVNHDGRVGIGSDNPGAKLKVDGPAGIVQLAGGSTGSSVIYGNADSNHVGELIQLIDKNNVQQLVMTNAGNLGIGTSSATAKLELPANDTSATVSHLGLSSHSGINLTIPNSVNRINQIVWTNQAATSHGYGSIGMEMTTGSGVGTGDMFFSTKDTGSNAVSTERMRIKSDGNVGIGTNNPQAKLEIYEGNNYIRFGQGSNSIAQMELKDQNPVFYQGWGSAARIALGTTGANNFELSTAALEMPGTYTYNSVDGFQLNYPTGRIQLGFNYNSFGAEIILGNNRTASGETAFIQYRTNGVNEGSLVGNGSGFTISNVSDYRKKENITELANGSLTKIANVRPVTYTLREEYTNDTSKVYTGFIAHEFQEQFPNSVRGVKDELNEDGSVKLQSIDITSNELLTHLIKSIQELKTENDLLKTRVEALE